MLRGVIVDIPFLTEGDAVAQALGIALQWRFAHELPVLLLAFLCDFLLRRAMLADLAAEVLQLLDDVDVVGILLAFLLVHLFRKLFSLGPTLLCRGLSLIFLERSASD